MSEPLSSKGWIDLVDTVVLAPGSGLLVSILIMHASLDGISTARRRHVDTSYRKYHLGNFVEIRGKEMKFLVLHAFAYVFFIEDCTISDNLLMALAEYKGDLRGRRLRLLFEDVRAKNSFGSTVLHWACILNNYGIVKMILQGTRLVAGTHAVLALLIEEDNYGTIALEYCFDKADVARLLLCFESEQPASDPRRRQLTVPKRYPEGRNVFRNALEEAEESFALLCVQYALPEECRFTDDDNNSALSSSLLKKVTWTSILPTGVVSIPWL
jgi:hypothetical protein